MIAVCIAFQAIDKPFITPGRSFRPPKPHVAFIHDTCIAMVGYILGTEYQRMFFMMVQMNRKQTLDSCS